MQEIRPIQATGIGILPRSCMTANRLMTVNIERFNMWGLMLNFFQTVLEMIVLIQKKTMYEMAVAMLAPRAPNLGTRSQLPRRLDPAATAMTHIPSSVLRVKFMPRWVVSERE